MAVNPNLRILRHLASELRTSSFSGTLKDSPAFPFILNQYRRFKVTDQQLCKAQEEMRYMSETYLCYLKSSRQYVELHKQYQGKGERSTEETANLVGFKLPHDPK
ncbi:hypothetical protein J6590_020766 [Homalodisca vitripennis]|nr:hypothetical protein J6590_020766 [Homalodisca vitripennis]